MELVKCLTSYVSTQPIHLQSVSLNISKGAYFRNRYISSPTTLGSSVLTGLSSWNVDNDQITVLTIDDESTAVAAQAFMQAFYPPYSLGSNSSGQTLDPSSVLANNTYIDNPLNGYQYPLIQTFTALDPNSIYISGTDSCIEWDLAEANYYNGPSFNDFDTNTWSFYQSLGPEMLSNVLPEDGWSFGNAYTIYDYVSYQNNHNATVASLLENTETLAKLYELASLKEYNITGDQTVSGVTKGDKILTIAGQTLAAKIVDQLYLNVATLGASPKLTLMVGDFGPMLSLFSLLSLPSVNPAFAQIPSFGSALVFELFSWSNTTNPTTYPSIDQLFVRFYYQNSTANGSSSYPDLEAYSLFDNGPSMMDMGWTSFETAISGIMTSEVGDWCDICQSPSLFCAAFNQSSSSGGSANDNRDMTLQVAGVIGAGVTLGVGAILVGLAMLVGGLRFHRRPGLFERKSSLGGFKGTAKLASDADLNLPKHGAPIVGAAVASKVVEEEAKSGHERVGSWELRDSPTSLANDKPMEEGRFSNLTRSTVGERSSRSPSHGSDGPGFERRPSFEADDEINFSNPTRARESI